MANDILLALYYFSSDAFCFGKLLAAIKEEWGISYQWRQDRCDGGLSCLFELRQSKMHREAIHVTRAGRLRTCLLPRHSEFGEEEEEEEGLLEERARWLG